MKICDDFIKLEGHLSHASGEKNFSWILWACGERVVVKRTTMIIRTSLILHKSIEEE